MHKRQQPGRTATWATGARNYRGTWRKCVCVPDLLHAKWSAHRELQRSNGIDDGWGYEREEEIGGRHSMPVDLYQSIYLAGSIRLCRLVGWLAAQW